MLYTKFIAVCKREPKFVKVDEPERMCMEARPKVYTAAYASEQRLRRCQHEPGWKCVQFLRKDEDFHEIHNGHLDANMTHPRIDVKVLQG